MPCIRSTGADVRPNGVGGVGNSGSKPGYAARLVQRLLEGLLGDHRGEVGQFGPHHAKGLDGHHGLHPRSRAARWIEVVAPYDTP